MRQTTDPRFDQKRRRPFAHVLLLLAALVLGALPALAQTSMTGFWVLNVPTGDGNTMKTFFDLAQSGEQVTGTAWIRYNKMAISEGSFRRGKLHLVVALSARNPERQARYDGTVEGDKLSLTVHFPGRPVVEASGERTTQEAMAPPPRLPLPELHEVPENGLALAPPMGWNSWNKFHGMVDDVTVRGIADAMA